MRYVLEISSRYGPLRLVIFTTSEMPIVVNHEDTPLRFLLWKEDNIIAPLEGLSLH